MEGLGYHLSTEQSKPKPKTSLADTGLSKGSIPPSPSSLSFPMSSQGERGHRRSRDRAQQAPPASQCNPKHSPPRSWPECCRCQPMCSRWPPQTALASQKYHSHHHHCQHRPRADKARLGASRKGLGLERHVPCKPKQHHLRVKFTHTLEPSPQFTRVTKPALGTF